MSAERITIEPRNTVAQGPWEQPVRSALPVPLTDPRLDLTDQALVAASQNAFPIVATQNKRRDGVGLAAGGAIALVLGAATFMSLSSGRHATVPATTTASAQSENPGLALAPTVPGKPVALPPAGMPVPAQPGTAPMPMPVPGMAHGNGLAVPPGMAPGSSPVLVFDGSGPPGGTATAGPNMARDSDGAPTMLAGAAAGAGLAFNGDNNSARSTKLANPATTVVQGTLIPAVLETAIDTDVPGYVRAVVSQDVRSFDGSKVLIPRSSRLIGEYKAASQAGQRRAYLMWTRLVRPDGVSVALASPAADFSGQAGVGGQVNNHFFSRFGSAILLSILGGAGSLVSGGASTVVVGGGQSAASAAIQQSGNRAPTIKVRQGEPIRVFTARDLIFGDGANG